MTSRMTSDHFWDTDGSEEGTSEEDEIRRRKKANIPGKLNKFNRIRHVSREAAFVSAFEETDIRRRPVDHSSRLPHENDAPFEGFLVAAFSTLLALLLAWRFLAWNPENGGSDEHSKASTHRVSKHHDPLRAKSLSPTRQLTSSPDSSSGSSSGDHWAWLPPKACSSDSASSSSKTSSRKQRRKRRQFDEKYAPKRRIVDTVEFEKRDQLSPSLSETEDASRAYSTLLFDSSPIELERGEFSNNPLSRRNNAIEWPSTADEDALRHLIRGTTSTPKMEMHFRTSPQQHDDVEDDDVMIRMISTPSSLAPSFHHYTDTVPSENMATIEAPNTVYLGTSSTRRPLVSPPPPPTEHTVCLASTIPKPQMAQEQMPQFPNPSPPQLDQDDEEDSDFIGSDLPPGFVNNMADEIARSTNLLLEDLAKAEALLLSRQCSEISRDLDTITEVSENEDLTSLSSNGCLNSKSQSKNNEIQHGWSKSSTALYHTSQTNDSECYRRAPTVTACASSSETVNDYDEGEEAYVDGEPLVSTAVSISIRGAPITSISHFESSKIDHDSRKAGKLEGNDAGDSEELMHTHGLYPNQIQGQNGNSNRLDNEEPSTPTSSGRTSIATDLPEDYHDPLAANESHLGIRNINQIHLEIPNQPIDSPRLSPATDDDVESLVEVAVVTRETIDETQLSSFTIQNQENASGVKTSSPNLVLDISTSTNDRPISPRCSLASLEGGARSLVTFKEDPCSLSSRPKRESRFLLAYQQYHTEQDGDSDISTSLSSNLTSTTEHTKTILSKHVPAEEEGTSIEDGSSFMDQIDLQKALQRFARYGELYGDATRSGMDEFRTRQDLDDSSTLDGSSFDAASRVNSLPNGGMTTKIEALLKSTSQAKGHSVNGVSNAMLSTTSPLTKRGRDNNENDHCVIGGTKGAVHALATTSYNLNGDYSETGTTNVMNVDRKQETLINGEHGLFTNNKRADGTSVVPEDSNKTNTTVTSTILSYEVVTTNEFQPPSRPYRLISTQDRNRFSPRSSALDVGNGVSASGTTITNSNYDGIYNTRIKSNSPGDAIREAPLEREFGDKKTRPTSAPLTPLLIASPASSGLGLGLHYVASFDQTTEPVCVASATSQAIINDPNSLASQSAFPVQKKIVAEASANAVASNPYLALARATTAAATKAAQASNENLLDDGIAGTVSLVVSSTVTTTKRDFYSTTKSTPDLVFFSSTDVLDESGLELKNREMSYQHQHQHQRPTEITPTYGVIPRGTASIFQQRHRELSPSHSGILRSPERKRHNYGQEYSNGADSKTRSSATTPIRSTQESKKVLFASSDHLQKLLEDPYYVKPQEKPEPPKRSPPKTEIIQTPTSQTSPQRTIPLSERNVLDWSRRPENSLENQKQQNLLRWRNSMNLSENEELRQAMLEDQKRENLSTLPSIKSPRAESVESSSIPGIESKRSSSIRATTPVVPELWDYKIFREAQQRAEADVDEETKRARRNKYKAKIERAKRDYLTTKASASDLYRSIEDFEKKFNVSMDNVRLPDPPRGPYLEYLSRSGHLHIIDINDLPPPAYVRQKPRFDREYESIVKKAEESWAAYRKRLHAAAAKHGDDLYARSRAFSTGVLETDVDDLSPYQRGQKSIVETDLDEVQREQQRASEHESRKRSKTPAANGVEPTNGSRVVHSRAKSADYLMDQRARTEIEPPENQLRKILGDKDEKDLSEHELRFRKSTEKLPVPDWYLNSEYCPGGKIPSPGSPKSRSSAYREERPMSTQSYRYYDKEGSKMQPSSFAKSPTPTAVSRQEDTSSRYVSPWVYGGRISGPGGLKQTPESTHKGIPSPISRNTTPSKATESPRLFARPAEPPRLPELTRPEPRKATESPKHQSHTISTKETYSISKSMTKTEIQTVIGGSPKPKKEELVLPKHFFDKYKDEIEELRKSRTALNATMQDIDDEATWEEQQQKRLSTQGLPVPIATVRPNQLHYEDFNTTASLSFSPTSSPDLILPTRPGHIGQTTKSQQQPQPITKPSPAPRIGPSSTTNRDVPLTTSTPYSSDMLPRKAPPTLVKETAFEPYRHSPAAKETAFEAFPHRQEINKPVVQHQPAPAHHIIRRPSLQSAEPRYMPGGWTVSAVPADWNVPGQRDSVVIEVAGDGLFDSGSAGGPKGRRLPSHLTLEEILDTMFSLPVSERQALKTINESSSSLLDDVLPARPRTPTNLEGPGIYTQNQQLMDKLLLEPELATELLKREKLWVKCGYCNKARETEEARRRGYVSCHHCYTYYCNRVCRRADWDRHLDICSYARINTLCKQVILKVRQDLESQHQMSRVAQRGYQSRGRGSVNFRFFTVNMAKAYVKDHGGGWRSLRAPPAEPSDFLRYYTVPDLIDAQKDPSLINLCRRYDPRSKFVLSVSIMADIEECPETPPPELEGAHEAMLRSNQDSSWYQRGVGAQPYSMSNTRPQPLSGTELSWMTETKKPHHSNGFAKDDFYDYQPPQGQYNFSRADQYRHTVAAPQRQREHYSPDGGQWHGSAAYPTNGGRPGVLIGPEDADETEV